MTDIKESIDKVYGFYRNKHSGIPPSDQITPTDEKNIIEIFEKRKYLGDVQKIITVFVDINNWFNIRRSFEYPPICVDHKGLYLNFRFVKDILLNLDGKKRISDDEQMKKLASVMYSIANDDMEREEAKYMFIDFIRGNSPSVFQNNDGEEGLSIIFSERNIILKFLLEDAPLYYSIWKQYIYDYYLSHANETCYTFDIAMALVWGLYDPRDENISLNPSQIELYMLTQFRSDISSLRSRYSNIIGCHQKDITIIIQNNSKRKAIIQDISLIINM